jgi:hypothetical protein
MGLGLGLGFPLAWSLYVVQRAFFLSREVAVSGNFGNLPQYRCSCVCTAVDRIEWGKASARITRTPRVGVTPGFPRILLRRELPPSFLLNLTIHIQCVKQFRGKSLHPHLDIDHFRAD